MWNYNNFDEIYHHGIRGQKWGIRRYQYKDGSLTPAGKRRAEKLENKYYKVTGKKITQKKQNNASSDKKKLMKDLQNKKNKQTNVDKKKSIKDMTNEELAERTNRMNLERNYIEADKNLRSVSPKKVSKGKKFVKYVNKNVIVPSATNIGKQWVNSLLAKASNDTQFMKDNPSYKIYPNNKRKD